MSLKTLREARGFSQLGLSRLSGVTPQTINDMESGRNTNPSWKNVARLAYVLEADPHAVCPVELPVLAFAHRGEAAAHS